MKRLVTSFLTLILTFSVIMPTHSFASESLNVNFNGDSSKKTDFIRDIQQRKMIKQVEPYVAVTDDGKLFLKDTIPGYLYEKYDLDGLKHHFETMNSLADTGEVTINEDLSIDDHSILDPSLNAVYGKWTYHWWGYDRLFNNRQAKDFADYAASVSAGAGIVTGVGAFFPPVAAIAGIQTGYWALVAARVNANNKGRGVKIAVTWVAVFSVSSL